MNEQSDTPRTDASKEIWSKRGLIDQVFKTSEALEKELIVARENIATMIDQIGMLQTKDKAVTEQRDDLLRYNEAFRKETLICADCDSIRKEEYDQAIEQRDEIDSMYHKIIKEVLECDQIPACQREDDQLEPPWKVIARVRKQRDRLAEAVNAATILIAAKGRHNTMLAYEGLRDALQSLTTNEQ